METAQIEAAQIRFTAKGMVYIASMSANAMCLVEDQFGGQGFPVILAELADPAAITIGKMRRLFWGVLIDHQPEVTVQQAGELIMAVGGLAKALEIVTSAIVAGGVLPVEAPPARKKR